MKKSKLRGFTLIEMIVVVAIIGIIMVGLANFFVPIRRVFVDSTSYESYRTVQQGMSRYIAENTRYATAISIYQDKSITSAEKAKDAFISEFPTMSTEVKQSVRVITIDNTNKYTIKGNDYYGRLRMFKYNPNASPAKFQDYVAMGGPFYDEMSYSVALTPITGASSGLNIQVTSSSLADTSGALKKASDTKVVSTTDAVLYPNLSSPINGKYNLNKFKDGSGNIPSTVTKGTNTYIAYTTQEIKK